MSSMLTGHRNPLLRAESLEELCAWYGADFIRCAYVTILGRRPDASGEAYYLDGLYSGVSKLTLISQMRMSSEGRLHDPGIAGLDRALRKHRNACRPLIGPIVRLFTGRSGNSFRGRQAQVFAGLAASLEKVSQQQNDRDARLYGQLGALQSTVADQIGRLGSDMAALTERVSQQQGDRDVKLHDQLEALQSLVADQIGKLGSDIIDRLNTLEVAEAEILDTERALTELTVALSSKVDELGSDIQATALNIGEVKSSSERARGLILKANRQALG